MQVKTYRDVKQAIPRGIRQGAVANVMGYDAGVFSNLLASDPDGRPSPEFLEKFTAALEALAVKST